MYRFEKKSPLRESWRSSSSHARTSVLTDRSGEIADDNVGRLDPGGGTKFGPIDPLVQSADLREHESS